MQSFMHELHNLVFDSDDGAKEQFRLWRAKRICEDTGCTGVGETCKQHPENCEIVGRVL